MATLDHRPARSPDCFLLQPWSSFVTAATPGFVDDADSDKEPSKAVQLSKEEMFVSGRFTALEDFSLVVCHVCNKVVTPQGVLAHYEKRHASPVPSRSPLVPMKPKAPAAAPGPRDALAFRVPKDYPHSRFSKAPLAVYPPKGARNKARMSLPVVSLEKMPCLNRSDAVSHVRLTSSSSSSSSSPSSLKPLPLTPPAVQRPSEKLANGRGTATPPSSLDRRAACTLSPSQLDRKFSPSPALSQRSGAVPTSSSLSSSSPLEKKPQNGTKTSSRSHKRLSGRVFDPNKHCGVQDPDTQRPCTRSLTCKTHSLTHRRAVPGRRKHFDVLLAEHKGRAKEKEGAKEKERDGDGAQGGRDGCSQSSASQESAGKPHCPNGRPLSTLKLRLANAHIPRAPGPSTSSPPAPVPAPALDPEPSPPGGVAAPGAGGRLSSDEEETESPEDHHRPAFNFSNHHPQPSGFCVFSSRLMGRGHYAFDRRWDRMRLALQSMVEKHLNAQMWRKVPLAAESLRSLPSSGTSSSVRSRQTSSPTSVASPPLSSPTDSAPDAPAFPQSSFTPGRARNGAQKNGRPSKDAEDSVARSKKRKSSPLFLTVDNHKKNGTSCHPTLQGWGGAAASPARKKGLGLGGSGLWRSGDDCRNSLGSTGVPLSSREPASSPHQPPPPPPPPLPPPPSGPLAFGGGVEGRKRRSPSSYRGKAGKLSKPGRLESLFGKGKDIGGMLASGPESPRQAKLHH